MTVRSRRKTCDWCGGTGVRLVENIRTHEKHGMPCACTVADLPIRFLYQAEGYGCGIAAVAMATERTYADVRRLFSMAVDLTGHSVGGGVDVAQAEALLDALGFSWVARYETDARLGAKRNPWPCAPWADVHLAHVQNLSDTNGHYVVLLGDGRVLDPWWGVIQGLHRYPRVYGIKAIYPLAKRRSA